MTDERPCKKCKHLIPADRYNSGDENPDKIYSCELWECEFEEGKKDKGE